MHHVCNYYCDADTHADVFPMRNPMAEVDPDTSETIFALLDRWQSRTGIIPVAVREATEPSDVYRHDRSLLNNGQVVPVMDAIQATSWWLVTFRWRTPEESRTAKASADGQHGEGERHATRHP